MQTLIPEVKPYEVKPEDYAAIYARISNKKDNMSIPSQIELALRVIKDKKLILFKIYEDKESATKFHYSKRPGFSKLIKDAEAGLFRTVVVFRRDRLARIADQLIEIKKKFKKIHVQIIYSNRGEFQASGDSYMSDFIENIIMAVDELEPKIISERTAAGRERKRTRREYDCGGNVPYGYHIDTTKKPSEYIFDKSIPNIKETIKSIFDKFISFDTSNYKTKYLLEEINRLPNRSKNFTYTDIHGIITNPVYAGLQTINLDISKEDAIHADPVTGQLSIDGTLFHSCTNVESAINKSIWLDAMLKWRMLYPLKTRETPQYLFKGLLRCSRCGKKIHKESAANVYTCSQKGCTRLPADIVINTILEKIVDDIMTPGNIECHFDIEVQDIESEIRKLNKRLVKIKAEQEKEMENLFSTIPVASDDKILVELLDEERKINEVIYECNTKISSITLLKNNINRFISTKSKASAIKRLKDNAMETQELLESSIEEVVICGTKKSCRIIEIKY